MQPPGKASSRLRVEVAYVAPDRELLRALDLPDGATVDDAVRASGLAAVETAVYAIFGRRVPGATLVADGNRIEITRPLVCDPKLVRRNRAAKAASPKTGSAR